MVVSLAFPLNYLWMKCLHLYLIEIIHRRHSKDEKKRDHFCFLLIFEHESRERIFLFWGNNQIRWILRIPVPLAACIFTPEPQFENLKNMYFFFLLALFLIFHIFTFLAHKMHAELFRYMYETCIPSMWTSFWKYVGKVSRVFCLVCHARSYSLSLSLSIEKKNYTLNSILMCVSEHCHFRMRCTRNVNELCEVFGIWAKNSYLSNFQMFSFGF